MNERPWERIAASAVASFGVRAGHRVEIRECAGRPEILETFLLEVERAGAVPCITWTPPMYVRSWLQSASAGHIAACLAGRAALVEDMDRIFVLSGELLSTDDLPAAAVKSWRDGIIAISAAEERRRIPYRLVAVPTFTLAEKLNVKFADLSETIVRALLVPAVDLRHRCNNLLAVAGAGSTFAIRTPHGCILTLQAAAGRAWISDHGLLDEETLRRGGIVSNLPAGSVYTTVAEDKTEGRLFLREAVDARDVVLAFRAGRIVDVQARTGAEQLQALFDRHSGEARRISHIGIGLNPNLHDPLGWILADEHIAGALFIALGENRYMGGGNASSLNVDFVALGATFEVDGRAIVRDGRVIAGTSSGEPQ